MAELELNKIVGMIMENPELIEKIKAMSSGGESDTHTSADATEMPEVSYEEKTYAPKASKRNELLSALKSFLSEERKRSLETMMTIADVLDTVKRK